MVYRNNIEGSIDKKIMYKKEKKVRENRLEKKYHRNKSIEKESMIKRKNTYIFIHMFIHKYIY